MAQVSSDSAAGPVGYHSRPDRLDTKDFVADGFPSDSGFYDWHAIFPDLVESVVPHIGAMRAEALKLGDVWTPWPETKLYKAAEGAQWRVMPFCYTFPSNDPSATRWVEPAAGLCPTIWSVLKSVPGVRTALLSRMGPGTKLSYHYGWAELANHVLRIHVGLEIPGNGKQCGVAVDDVHQHHYQGGLLCFDDSRKHMAYNTTGKDRYVLIFDIARPSYVPGGVAVLGRTDELDAFIDYFEAGMRAGASAPAKSHAVGAVDTKEASKDRSCSAASGSEAVEASDRLAAEPKLS